MLPRTTAGLMFLFLACSPQTFSAVTRLNLPQLKQTFPLGAAARQGRAPLNSTTSAWPSFTVLALILAALGTVSLLLTRVALIASYIPEGRTAKIDPMVALRDL